jgi:hypothetical protein
MAAVGATYLAHGNPFLAIQDLQTPSKEPVSKLPVFVATWRLKFVNNHIVLTLKLKGTRSMVTNDSARIANASQK